MLSWLHFLYNLSNFTEFIKIKKKNIFWMINPSTKLLIFCFFFYTVNIIVGNSRFVVILNNTKSLSRIYWVHKTLFRRHINICGLLFLADIPHKTIFQCYFTTHKVKHNLFFFSLTSIKYLNGAKAALFRQLAGVFCLQISK